MKNILFVGELPPRTTHGISNSNKVNIDILSSYFNVFIIEEIHPYQEHKKQTISKIRRIFSLHKNIREITKKNKIDFFYASMAISYFGMFKNLFLLRAFRKKNKASKVVFHVHRGDFDLFYNSSIFAQKLVNLLVSQVDKLIFLSPSLIPSFLKNSEKIFCLANTIYPEKKYSVIPSKKRDLLYLSNYIKEKGIIDLLDVFKEIDNQLLKLSCYGNFTDILLKEEIESYRDNGITINDSVREEKFNLINNSDALVLPSYNEGQPLVILEAMMCGTVVIVSDVGDIRNMVGKSYPFLFEKGNKKELKKMIQRFLEMDTQELNMIASELQCRYFEYYSNKKHKNKLITIFS